MEVPPPPRGGGGGGSAGTKQSTSSGGSGKVAGAASSSAMSSSSTSSLSGAGAVPSSTTTNPSSTSSSSSLSSAGSASSRAAPSSSALASSASSSTSSSPAAKKKSSATTTGSPRASTAVAGAPAAAKTTAAAKPGAGVLRGCEVFVNPALDTARQEEYRKLVRENGGGVQYYFDASKTTHVITADLAHFADLDAARQAKIHLITPQWLLNSVRFGELEDVEFYSPDPKKFFSGLCICTSKINAQTRDMMLAGVVAFGGRISRKLNERCTHLVMQGTGYGSKYQWARAHNIKIVSVSWYNESITRRKLEPEEKHPVNPSDESALKKQENNTTESERRPKQEERRQPTFKQSKDEDDDETLMSQFEVNLQPTWKEEDDEEEDEESKLDAERESEREIEFNLLFGLPNKGDKAGADKKGKRHEDDVMSEDEKDANGKDDKDEESGGEDELAMLEGAGIGDGSATGDAGMSVAALTRAAQIEEEIKTYIRNNAQHISARELRLKFKMGHPRAKRLLKEVMFEMQREIKQSKKRKVSDEPNKEAQPLVEKPEKVEKQDAKEVKVEEKTTQSRKISKPDKVVTAAEKGTLMKDLHILLVDLSDARLHDTRDAIKEMGGVPYPCTSEDAKIEGVTWKKGGLPPFTHLLYQDAKPSIDALKTKLEQHGVIDVHDVSVEWVKWCDLHLRLFTPEISPLFQPLPLQPITGMDQLIISQSNTRGWEREEILSLVTKLGAKYNRSMPNEPNVILITVPLEKGAPKSEKVTMAREWGVPVIRKEWLYECARQWKRLSTDDFLASEEDDENKDAVEAPTKPSIKEKKGRRKSKPEDEPKGKKGKRKGDEDVEDNDMDLGNEEGEDEGQKNPMKRKSSANVASPLGAKRCIQCGATKTPCWRKGADGERNLCNACGLKYSAEMRRRQNKFDPRKRKKNSDDMEFGRFGDDDDDDYKKVSRRSLTSSGSALPKKRSSEVSIYDPTRKVKRQRGEGSEDEENKETSYIIDEEVDDPDQMQQKVRKLLASEDDQPRYHFAFSCIPKAQQTKFKRIVTKLGGTYSDVWEPGVSTHLILGLLRRTEKMLCACASGSWVLRPSYLTKCDVKGRFVREERHEWFEEEWDDPQEKRIWGGCMRRHRLNLIETGNRPFEDWDLHLVGDTEPLPDIMAKIIEAGGGKCISSRSLAKYKKHKEHRYVLIGSNPEKKAVKRAKELGMPCVESIFMANYLCGRTPPSVDDYLV